MAKILVATVLKVVAVVFAAVLIIGGIAWIAQTQAVSYAENAKTSSVSTPNLVAVVPTAALPVTGQVVVATATPSLPVVVSATPIIPRSPVGSGLPSQVVTPGPLLEIDLRDGRSYNPRSVPVDQAIGYEPYQDTGVGKNREWKIPGVPAGYALIAGGVRLNGYNQGIIQVWIGPQGPINLDITDGFYNVETISEAPGDLCVRVQQHLDNKWLLSKLSGVPAAWETACPVLRRVSK
jgi:hypothetical protein